METKRRSIAKAFSWRFIAALITAGVVWIFTRRFEFALTVGLMDTSVKLLIYFFHERIWNRIPYGRIKNDEYQI